MPANAVVALLAAGAWGAGDFAGGMGVKVSGGGTASAVRVICVAHALSLFALLSLYIFHGAAVPHGRAIVWALLAGVVAGLSITAFYMALARGAMGISAAVSGLLAAAIPAAASSLLEGRPSAVQLAGFCLAGAAIWLVASGPDGAGEPPPGAAADLSRTGTPQRRTSVMTLAVLGGLGFGAYFLLLRLANPLGVLGPVAFARVGSLSACLTLLALLRPARSPHTTVKRIAALRSRRTFLGLTTEGLRWALGVAVLDTGGNLLFVASTRLGRLDVASVLASLYPASTILLAAFYLHERPTRKQLAGMVVGLAAVVLVAA